MEILYLLIAWVASLPLWCYSDICCSVFVVHLWRYRGGYPALTECLKKLNNNKVCRKVSLLYSYIEKKSAYMSNATTTLVNAWMWKRHCRVDHCIFLFLSFKNILIFLQEYLEFRKERAKMLISRRNQLLLEFSFWNEPLPRPGPNIYEMRTYNLKVCTFIILTFIIYT